MQEITTLTLQKFHKCVQYVFSLVELELYSTNVNLIHIPKNSLELNRNPTGTWPNFNQLNVAGQTAKLLPHISHSPNNVL